MKIIGIDPSLTGTAIAIVNERKQVVEVKRFVSNARKLDGDRIDTLLTDVCDYLANVCRDAETRIFIEGYALNSRVGKALTRAEYVGVLKHILRLSNLHYWIVVPTALKKYTTGKGSWKGKSEKAKHKTATKEAMINAVAEKYAYIADNDDIADAVALAMYGYAIIYEDNRELAWTSESVLDT